MSEYEEGYYASQNNIGGNAYRSGKAAGGLLGLGLGAVIKLLPLAVRLVGKVLVAAPYLVLGLGAASLVPGLGAGFTDARLFVGTAAAFGFYLALYWLKGVAIALHRRSGRWGLALVLCLVLACLVPALLLHGALARALPAPGMVLFTWVVPVALAATTYYNYRPTLDYAPGLALRAYRLGYQAAI